MKRYTLIMLVFIIPLTMTGCWDRVELEEEAYVISVGIDKAKDNENMFSITYRIADTEGASQVQNGGQRRSGEDTSEIITLSAPEFLTGRDLITASVARRLNFSHVRVLVIGESLATTPDVYRAIMSTLRDREFRRYAYVMVSRESAEDFIRSNKPRLEKEPHKFYDYISRRWLEVGLVPIPTVSNYVERFEMKSSLFLGAYCTTVDRGRHEFGYESDYLPGEIDKRGGNPAQIIGSSVFKESKMIGSLTGEETRLAMLMSPDSKADQMFITFPDPFIPEKRLSARMIKQGNVKIKADISGEIPKIEAKVAVQLKLLSIPSRVNYTDNEDNRDKLKEHFAKYMEEKSMLLVKRTKEEFEGEPFQWSLAVRRKFWTLEEFLKYDWMKKYPKAKVSIKYDVKIIGTGKLLKSPGK